VLVIVVFVAWGTLELVASFPCTLELAKRGSLEVVGVVVGASVVASGCFTAASRLRIVTVSNESTNLRSCLNCSVGWSFNLPSSAALQFANAFINLSVGVKVGFVMCLCLNCTVSDSRSFFVCFIWQLWTR
jgi:hypothetical protein